MAWEGLDRHASAACPSTLYRVIGLQECDLPHGIDSMLKVNILCRLAQAHKGLAMTHMTSALAVPAVSENP